MGHVLNRPLIICGFPKSGNTWLGLILSYYYDIPYLDAHDKLNEEARFHYAKKRKDREQASLKRSHRDHSSSWTSVIKFHSHLSELNRDSFPVDSQVLEVNQIPILILREPKDVAVSYYYYNYFHVPILQGYQSSRAVVYLRLLVRKAFYFDRFVLKVASQWRDFHRGWVTTPHHSIKYEDLISDAYGTVRKLIERLDGNVNETNLRWAVECCEFNQLREIEKKQARYHSRSQYFFREGGSGGWARHFGRGTQEGFTTVLAETYAAMGYGERPS